MQKKNIPTELQKDRVKTHSYHKTCNNPIYELCKTSEVHYYQMVIYHILMFSSLHIKIIFNFVVCIIIIIHDYYMIFFLSCLCSTHNNNERIFPVVFFYPSLFFLISLISGLPVHFSSSIVQGYQEKVAKIRNGSNGYGLFFNLRIVKIVDLWSRRSKLLSFFGFSALCQRHINVILLSLMAWNEFKVHEWILG